MKKLGRFTWNVWVWLVAAGVLPGTAAAQTDGAPPSAAGARWDFVDAIGYGGLGFGVGLMSAWDMDYDSGALMVGIGTVLGATTGAVIGRRARRAIGAAEPVGGGHRVAVVTGAILGGGTLGALASVPLVNGRGEGTFLGSDERTVTLLVAAGTMAGTVFAWRHRSDFGGRPISIVPARFRDGGHGVQMTMRF